MIPHLMMCNGWETINTLLSIYDVINNSKAPSRWCGRTSSNLFMEWMHQNPHEKCSLRSVVCRHGCWPLFVLHAIQGYPIIRGEGPLFICGGFPIVWHMIIYDILRSFGICTSGYALLSTQNWWNTTMFVGYVHLNICVWFSYQIFLGICTY